MDQLATRIDQLSPLQRAAFLVKEAQGKLEALQRAQNEPIAIVGLSCRFPGASNPDEFWKLLAGGVNAIREIPSDRWDTNAFYDPDPRAPGKMNTRWGGFLERIDEFDNTFFGISAQEAARMDPQQRLMLELALEAMEDAGIAPDRLAGSKTGVFIGVSLSEYGLFFLNDLSLSDAYVGTGTSLCIVANRVSFAFDLRGPSVALDSACSSSLAGLHLACQSLRSGESRCALVGGANLTLTPPPLINLTKAGFNSPDGKCRSFDAEASGYVRSEGVGMVLLKTLSAALADNDPIHAVILASAMNHDGRNQGTKAPNRRAQEEVLREAYARAGVSPGKVQYVETQGTGTPIGDAIEIQALATVLATDRARGKPVAIGSVKTNLGHMEAASGMGSLIKTVLALKHRSIPANLHFNKPNLHAPFDSLPFEVPTQLRPWPQDEGPALAGVSAFGFGGTNVHVVLQDAPKRSSASESALRKGPARSLHLLPISAKTPSAVEELARAYRAYLTSEECAKFAEVCGTAAVGRQHHDNRIALLCPDRDSAVQLLDAFLNGQAATGLIAGSKPFGRMPKTVFVFADSLEGWSNVSRLLRANEPSFRGVLEDCDKALAQLANFSLLAWLDEWELDPNKGYTAAAAPALFALQVGLTATWRAWGVSPDLAVGFGKGEAAAAYVAGALSLADGLKAAWRRAKHGDKRPAQDPGVIESSDPTIPLVLGGLGLVRRGRDINDAYWSADTKVPIDLAVPLQALRERQPEVFLEVGPRVLCEQIASWAAANNLQSRSTCAFDGAGAGLDPFLSSIATLYAAGHAIVWDRIYPRTGMPARLPGYPWQRKRFWIDSDRYFPHSYGIADRHGLNGSAGDAGAMAVIAPVAKAGAASASSEWIYDVVWEQKAKTWVDKRHVPGAIDDTIHWLILLDKSGIGEQLATRLEAAGGSCTRVRADSVAALKEALPIQFESATAKWGGIVDLRALDAPDDAGVGVAELVESQGGLCAIISELVCRLVASPGIHATKLWVITRGAQPVDGEVNSSAVAQSALWGLGRTLALETPRHWGGLIDLDPRSQADEAAAGLLEQISYPDDETQIAYRSGRRYVARLVSHGGKERQSSPLRWRPDGAYVVSGGLGNLGPIVARWMIGQGARRLILLGRTPLPPRNAWSQLEPQSELGRKVAAVRELESLGASIHIATLDVADEKQLAAYLETYKAEGWPPIAGVIHLAGETHLSVIGGFTPEQYQQMFYAKSGGAWALHRAFLGETLDFFVLFSSSASILPSPLLGGFGAANASLDALAAYRRSLGLPVLSIDWSDWSQQSLIEHALKKQQLPAGRNVKGVKNAQALEILGQLLDGGFSQAAVIPLTAEDWLKRSAGPFENRVREEMVLRNPAAAAVRPRPELSTPYVAPATDLERYLADLWQTALKIDRVGVHDNFFELGGDSLQGAALLNRLQEGLKEVIHPHVLFETRCIHDYAVYLRKECATGVKRNFPSEVVAGKDKDWDPDWPAYIDEPEIEKARELLCGDRSHVNPNALPGPKNPRAIFVLSPPRSGSTLFRVMLAGHPQLFAPPELELLPYETLLQRRLAYTDDTVTWLEGADRALMEVRGCSAEEARAAMHEMEQSGMTVKSFYRLLQDAVPGRILVDKTPANATRIESLRHAETLFEDALYIHLLRHPCGMIQSYVEYKLFQTYVDRFRLRGKFAFAPRQMGELAWLVSNRNILEFLKDVPAERQCRVGFERLLAQPEETLRKLCDFMQLPYHPEMANPYQNKESKMTTGTRPEKRMHGDQKFLIAHKSIDPSVADRWKEEMSADVLGNPARAIAGLLGYTDVPPPMEYAPPMSAPSLVIPRLPSAAQTAADNLDQLSEADLDSLLQGMLLESQEKKS